MPNQSTSKNKNSKSNSFIKNLFKNPYADEVENKKTNKDKESDKNEVSEKDKSKNKVKDKSKNKVKNKSKKVNKQKSEKKKNKEKKSKQSKEERYKERAQNIVNKKRRRDAEADKAQFLMEDTPYYTTPSYILHNGKYISILQLYVRPGSNRNLTYEDVIDFMPVSTLSGVEIHLFNDDTLIKDDQKKRIIKKNASLNKETLKDTERSEGHKKEDDQSAKNTRQYEADDYDDYELIIDSSEPVVVFRWSIMIIADYQEDIEDQIEILNTLLDQRHDGAKWDSLPGEQYDRFTNLFDEIPKSYKEMTATAYNYSGLNLAINSGLNDAKGVPLGSNALSLTESSAYFDFEKSTKRQAMIAMTRSSSEMPQLYGREDSTNQISVPSLIAQYAANNYMINGHRVHHIVLNDFDYFEPQMFYRDRVINQIFKEYDVSKMTINPLQGFGEIEKVTQIYPRLVEKLTNIFDLMMNLKMTKEERAIVLSAIDNFYFKNGLWIDKAEEKPKLTNIVDVDQPELYPTMVNLLNQFESLATQAASNNRELRANNIETISSTLKQQLSAYTRILARTTSIESTNASQVYYSFKNIESLQLRQIQLVNIIDYVIYTAKKGDVIIIHGFDSVLAQVSEMVLETIKAAQNKGIRFLFTFDQIKSSVNQQGQLNDMFEMENKYYVDLDTDVDWSMVGRMIPSELNYYKKALNKELGLTISSVLQYKVANRVLLHRNEGQVNDFVNLRFIV